MKPVAVIEGPDGTGKTQLAGQFVSFHGFNLVHCGPPVGQPLRYYLRKLYASPGFTVADRFHGGSYVYGRVFRNGDDLNGFDRWVLEGYLRARGCVVVLTSLPRKLIDRNIDKRAHKTAPYELPERRQAVIDGFAEWSELTDLPSVSYDYTRDPILEVAYRVQHELSVTELEKTVRVPALGNTVAPDVLFVGDASARIARFERRCTRKEISGDRRELLRGRVARFRAQDPPFTGGYSGLYLKKVLDIAGLGLNRCCIINSRYWDAPAVDFVNAVPYVTRSDPGNVVALGNHASGRLTAAGIAHRTVPHPQYVRRFFYRRVDDYAELLTGHRPYEPAKWVAGRNNTDVNG